MIILEIIGIYINFADFSNIFYLFALTFSLNFNFEKWLINNSTFKMMMMMMTMKIIIKIMIIEKPFIFNSMKISFNSFRI